MHELPVQIVLLVRAFEEADRDGIVLSAEQRTAATRRAVMVTTAEGSPSEFSRTGTIRNAETVFRRARLLFNVLVRRVPTIGRVLELTRLRSLMGPTIFGIALLVGLATNLLGPFRHINLLAFPLLGLLAWNLASYVLMTAWAILRRSSRSADTGGRSGNGSEALAIPQERLVTNLAGGVVRLALWRSRRGWSKTATTSAAQARIVSRAFTRFCGLWHRATGQLLEARVRRRLHLAAMALVAGAVIGMYVRGMVFEYRATWESTLLDSAQAQALLDAVLGPASWVLGIDVPDVAPLRAPQDGPAAVWIHLYAMTALLLVGVPRLVLAGFEAARGLRLKHNLPLDLDDGYYRRALADWRGATKFVEILPYSFSPQPVMIELLKTLLYDFYGTQAEIRVYRPLSYGDELPSMSDPELEPEEGQEPYVVALFNLAQSPELEVHGAFLESLKSRAEGRGAQLLVLLDTSAYKQHFASDTRLEERRRAWQRVVSEVGLRAVDLDLGRESFDPARADLKMTAMREALWSGDA